MEVAFPSLLALLDTDAYFSLLLKRPLPEIWTLFLLCLARIVPVIALCPFLGGKIMPDSMKLGLAVALTPFFLPYLAVTATTPVSLDVTFILLMLKEVLIGSILGFFSSLAFYSAQGAGTLIDHQSGSQSLQVMDPSTQVQASPTGLLYNNVMIVAFFMIGGAFLYFDALMKSYQIFAVDQFLPAEFFSKQTPLYTTIVKMINQMMIVTIQLCAPSLIALLMSDLFLGIANRMAPQVQISFLLWSMKSYVGIALLWAGWWFILKQIEVHSLDWIDSLQNILKFFANSLSTRSP